MAQSTILAAAQTTATSSAVAVAVAVAAGATVTVALFSSTEIGLATSLEIVQSTPGTLLDSVGFLTKARKSVAITSPGTYYVKRYITQLDGVDVGVFTES